MCDREKDKAKHLILKLIWVYVGREAEQIGRVCHVSSAASQLCGGLRRFYDEPQKSLKLHALVHTDTMGFGKKGFFLLILNRSFNRFLFTAFPLDFSHTNPIY